jgi:hypothetical protein
MLHVRCAAIVSEVLPGSGAGNSKLLFSRHIFRVFWEQCSKSLWTSCIPPDTIFMTLVKTYDWMIDSSSAKRG